MSSQNPPWCPAVDKLKGIKTILRAYPHEVDGWFMHHRKAVQKDPNTKAVVPTIKANGIIKLWLINELIEGRFNFYG